MNSTSLQESNNSTNAVGHTGMVEVQFSYMAESSARS